jgi:hypothetical protein
MPDSGRAVIRWKGVETRFVCPRKTSDGKTLYTGVATSEFVNSERQLPENAEKELGLCVSNVFCVSNVLGEGTRCRILPAAARTHGVGPRRSERVSSFATLAKGARHHRWLQAG